MFEKVGETLRRLRRERRMTLEDLGGRAQLGRGQLSRIENGHQEPTLSTLAKILVSQGVSRREFFRRYDLVEDEASAVERDKPPGAADLSAAAAGGNFAGEVREALGRLETFIQGTLERSQTVAQGAFELGNYTVIFRVVPRGGGAETASEITDSAPSAPAPLPPSSSRRRPRRKRR